MKTITLAYVHSNAAAEIDSTIRKSIRDNRVSVLAMGLDLVKIKEKGLYLGLNCNNISQYVKKLSSDTKMNRSCIFNWLNIGKAYIIYKSELEKIGFGDRDGPTKLPYIERALKTKQRQEVFTNIKKMSVREFKTWVIG